MLTSARLQHDIVRSALANDAHSLLLHIPLPSLHTQICISMEGSALDRLQLPLMVNSAENDESMYTAFTVTVDLRKGTSTGISAADRAATLRAMANPGSHPDDFRRPGHIFPLRYRQGGVIVRPGHTEAAVDLARASGGRNLSLILAWGLRRVAGLGFRVRVQKARTQRQQWTWPGRGVYEKDCRCGVCEKDCRGTQYCGTQCRTDAFLQLVSRASFATPTGCWRQLLDCCHLCRIWLPGDLVVAS